MQHDPKLQLTLIMIQALIFFKGILRQYMTYTMYVDSESESGDSALYTSVEKLEK